VLCEKPVAYDYRDTRRAAALARERGLKTKLGFTFRYSPAMRYMKSLIDQGFIGTPYIFNGYEQNSQWLDPQTPLRQVDHEADQSEIQVSSLEGYGAPIMDLAHLFVGSRFEQVVGTMKNFVPERIVRATGTMMRMNIDDGDIFIGEFANGAIGSIQTSFVTVGNYPGIEARLYGSKGALICRLVEENGICESIKAAVLSAWWRAGRVVALVVLRQSHRIVHQRDPRRRARQRRQLRRRRSCAGTDQRRGPEFPSATVGVDSAA
jgi:predicted dehydrogenase